jgi:hypothetical protein
MVRHANLYLGAIRGNKMDKLVYQIVLRVLASGVIGGGSVYLDQSVAEALALSVSFLVGSAVRYIAERKEK